ncbi:MAG: hypothetical protein ACK44V_00560 [Burkholderiales bacterium]
MDWKKCSLVIVDSKENHFPTITNFTKCDMLLFFQRVVIMAFCFITFAMRKASFSPVLAMPVFRSIIGKPFLTRRCSGLTHKAASTAEVIR